MSKAGYTSARYALLGLIGGDPSRAGGLDPAGWDALGLLAAMHRLGPMLYHHTRDLPVIPTTLTAEWQASYRKSALRSLKLQRMLLEAAAVLNGLAMPWLALKGAWLAWHVYPHPALRPMRDIDLLVEESHVLAAYDALLTQGFERMVAHATPIATALAEHKHLPPLRHVATGLTLELHHRMLYAPAPGQPFSDVSALIGQAIRLPLGGLDIPLPDPTDSLLHFIIHSAHDHDLDNGPLVLCDIAAAAQGAIDWSRLWQMAELGGWMQGSRLLVALTRHHIAGAAAHIPPPPGPDVPEAVMDAAAQMLLPDRRMALAQSLGAETDIRGTLALARRLLPARHVVAAAARVPDTSAWVWRHYPLWLTRKLASLRQADRHQVQIDVALTREVRQWLNDHGR